MGDYLPKFSPGYAVTFTASTDVIGGRLVEVTGSRLVGPAGNDSARVVGVAAVDTNAGDKVTVFCRPSGVHPLPASGAIAAGARVASDTAGRVKDGTAATNRIGIALKAALAAGDVVEVMFTPGAAS